MRAVISKTNACHLGIASVTVARAMRELGHKQHGRIPRSLPMRQKVSHESADQWVNTHFTGLAIGLAMTGCAGTIHPHQSCRFATRE